MTVFSLLVISQSALAADSPKTKVPLPHYSIILDAQLRCDNSGWNKYPWKEPSSTLSRKLAYKTLSILSGINLTEEKRENETRTEEHRDFKLNYKAHARIFCGEETDLVNVGRGELYTTLPGISHPPNRSDLITIDDNDRPPLEFAYHFFRKYDDLPNPSGLEGMACIVRLENFLKDPLKSIDLKKLCKGESKKKIAFTKKEILRVAALLKTKLIPSKEQPKNK